MANNVYGHSKVTVYPPMYARGYVSEVAIKDLAVVIYPRDYEGAPNTGLTEIKNKRK